MLILGIESSCDETSAAVVEMSPEHRAIRSNIVASQIDIHRRYGGVVPEIAGRAHIEAITKVTSDAIHEAGIRTSDLDAVAVTASPGLIGALLVGVNFAKSFAYARDLPLVPVDHVRAHAASAYLEFQELEAPFLALIVSGGHTCFYDVTAPTVWNYIGGTRDDAAGEAFDKVGRVLGCPYPAGAALDALAAIGDPDAFRLPSPAMRGSAELSFSGLKTACLNLINIAGQKGEEIKREDLAASLTAAVCTGITEKVAEALDASGEKTVVMAGGVAANSHLRRSVGDLCAHRGVRFCVPPVSLCGDNAAMVAAEGYFEFLAGVRAGTALNASAN